jgi:hypothetical protein
MCGYLYLHRNCEVCNYDITGTAERIADLCEPARTAGRTHPEQCPLFRGNHHVHEKVGDEYCARCVWRKKQEEEKKAAGGN